jgi:pimeloyl-ACP methyl ester carboxylesterase
MQQQKDRIILMHGALGAGSQLSELKTRLSDHFEVNILEFEGHGHKSHDAPDLSLENLSAQLLEMAGSDTSQRPHVFGYSLGGYVALYTALHHPEALDRIITLHARYQI